MSTTSVTSKGQVTIPLEIRKKMGIRQGSKLEFRLVRELIEVRMASSPVEVEAGGFGLVKSRKPPLPADFDAATLLARRR